MFDIKKAEEEAKAEVAEESTKIAKGKIKDKLKQIDSAKKIVSNLELEYAALLRDIGA